MEQVRRDLKILKKFDYAFLAITFVLSSGILYIGMQMEALKGIDNHVSQMVGRLDNHEGRIQKLEKWEY